MAKSLDTATISLRLALLGYMPDAVTAGEERVRLVAPVLAKQRELARRQGPLLSPIGTRIEEFLADYFSGTDWDWRLPPRTLVLDEPGLARAMSLPKGRDEFHSEHLSSYRLANGVLHNPTNDRRTTKGVFHIAEGGLPIQDDKIAVPLEAAARIFDAALHPPREALLVPWTADAPEPAYAWASLLLRPVVVPEVPGFTPQRSMEIRFFAPATLLANLDFVEGIFGNAGDPFLADNDAALDPTTWTGHTGAVILAPHLTKLRKKDLGLPHHDDATERQRRDGQCWSDEDELYNGGTAFKLCVRDERGVIVTVIADNYFGYCKKEVKAQISYAANLLGLVEEEHSGGALAFPRYNLGSTFSTEATPGFTFEDVVARDPDLWEVVDGGYATHSRLDDVVLVPSPATYSLRDAKISWGEGEHRRELPLRADVVHTSPDGYQVELTRWGVDDPQWALVGTRPTPTQAHKPATVSGGGKSEISKSITDAFVEANVYLQDFRQDLELVRQIVDRDFSDRFIDKSVIDERPLLSEDRSLGSVIKLLSPADDFTAEYNAWVEQIPHHVKELVFTVKNAHRREWGRDWMSHFSVPTVNGRAGHALRLDDAKIHVNMLRVGFDSDGSWRLFGLRHDFRPAAKVQTEDDITASITAPGPGGNALSRKYVTNCERLLFQRPDDAIHRGYDKQTERDIAAGAFLSNFAPLERSDAQAIMSDTMGAWEYSEPMRELIRSVADGEHEERYFVSSAHPRIVDGARTKNPRYLQERPDLADARATALADLASHLAGKVPAERPVRHSVDVVVGGRRNNPAEENIPPLCAYAPLHHMELPELMMEFISSMTGKSPSTTGAGSEGAMTKGPFNPLPSVYDLNAALLSFALGGYDGWISSAGVVGPSVRVDHDISLLVPELFARMSPEERDAGSLLAEGALEPVPDFEHDGELVLASRLGFRMTKKFTTKYFGRIFMHPHAVFTAEMLQPELQGIEEYAASVRTIVETHRRVAQTYFDDGIADLAVPPLKIVLGIMAYGEYEGLRLESPDFRKQFEREHILASDWYEERLDSAVRAEEEMRNRSIAHIEAFVSDEFNAEASERLHLREKLEQLRSNRPVRQSLRGTIGRQTRFA